MFTNLLIISILIIVFWLGATALYLYTSRQQKELQEEITMLQELLNKTNGEAG